MIGEDRVSSNANAPQRSGHAHSKRSGAERSGLARLLAIQEFGLLAVILVLAIAMFAFSGETTRKDREVLAPGSSVVNVTETSFRVKGSGAGASEREYLTSQGWSFVESEPGKFILVREHTVNRFLNSENLINVLTYASFIAIMAVGMTGVIIINGIDLSIGSIYGLSAVVGSVVLSSLSASSGGQEAASLLIAVPVGILVCVLVGGSCGAINGVATVGLNVHPFIITLGGMAVYRGVSFIISKGESIGNLPDAYRDTIRATIFGMNVVPTLVMVGVGLLGALVMRRTVFGRQMFALGGNETAAKYAGIAVGRVRIAIFTLAGALAGLSGAIAAGHLGGASSDTGRGYELDVIAAAVVGGAALSGGRGTAIGAVLGAVVIQLINNSFDLLGPRFGIDQNYRQIVIGLAIVLAVVIDQAKHRIGKGKKRAGV